MQRRSARGDRAFTDVEEGLPVRSRPTAEAAGTALKGLSALIGLEMHDIETSAYKLAD